MNTDEPTHSEPELAGRDPDAAASTRRRVLVYGLLAAIVFIMIGYCLLLVGNEEMAQDKTIQILIVVYPFVVGLTSLACILYTHLTSYVSEFKTGWSVVIVVGALMSLSAFVLPTFWYLQVWNPFRGKGPLPGEEST